MKKLRATWDPCLPKETPRDSIGGPAFLPAGVKIPACRRCESPLMLFLQFDLRAEWKLNFPAGSHLVLFICPKCNEIPTFDEFPKGKLPDQYWDENTHGHFYAAIFPPGKEQVVSQKPILVAQRLQFAAGGEEDYMPDCIRVGGEPNWLQAPDRYTCSCGKKLAFLAQISENLGFPKQPKAPTQPDSFSADDYCLFLGNEVYIFACPAQCNPRAVWITVQG